MNPDASKAARANEWLEMVRSKWRLQTMQHRCVFNNETGALKRLPTRIRRFLNGTPVDLKSEVLARLQEMAPYKSPVFDCEIDEDLVYRPVNTFIRKDGPEHTTGGKDPTYTIIQDLILNDEAGDLFGVRDESNCAQTGRTEYHWDEPTVQECPTGSQGVVYQITDISRDRETDLFSYRIREVHALTTHTPAHTVECDARRRTTVEAWDNVYGEPGAFRWDAARSNGETLQIPESCRQPDGTGVKVDVQRNPDCTYRVTVQTVEAKTDAGQQFSIYRDQYKTNSSERTLNAFAPLPRQGVNYASGTITRYTSERNEDGTWNNTTETEKERAVPASTTEVRRTPRGTLTTRVDTNQASPATGISSQFGSWKATKTPGGLFTNEYLTYTRTLVNNLGLMCSDTLFMKTHESQSSVTEVPKGSHHVPAASNGKVTTWTYDTDAEGFVTKRERTEQEHEVQNAVQRRSWGFLGRTDGYTHRSVAAPAPNLLTSNIVGRTVEIRRTNGGLYDVDVQTFTAIAGQNLGVDCSRTLYQHVHETSTSGNTVETGDTTQAGDGKTYRTTSTADPSTGAVTTRTQVTTENPVSDSRGTVRTTAHGKEIRITQTNAAPNTLPLNIKDGNAISAARRLNQAVGASLEWERTPGDRVNATATEFIGEDREIAHTRASDAFTTSQGSTNVAKVLPPFPQTAAAGGYGEFQARLHDDGMWEISTTTHRDKAVWLGTDTVITAHTLRTTTKNRGGAPGTPSKTGESLRQTLTRYGLYETELTTVQVRGGGVGGEISNDMFLKSSTTRTVAQEDDTSEPDPTNRGSGVYRAKSRTLGDDGAWVITEQTNTEQSVQQQRLEEQVTRYGLVKRITDMHTSSEGTALNPAISDVGKSRTVEVTRGGRYNTTRTELTPLQEEIAVGCSKTALLHTHTTTEAKRTKNFNHVPKAANGVYVEEHWALTDQGFWEKRKTENTEERQTVKTRQYKDAFTDITVTEELSNPNENGGQGGRQFHSEGNLQSVESTMTQGKRYNVRTTKETPVEVDSGWLHFEKTTDKGLAIYYDFIVFRNAKRSQVQNWVNYIQNKKYNGTNGSFANQPHISISPNKFKLWDGTVAITTTFTPKAWAAGGSTKDDNWEKQVEIKSVQFVPIGSSKLLKIVSNETHKRGGGVGKDRMESLVGSGVIKGSQFAYHPSGQSFEYDIITRIETKGTLIDMPKSDQTQSLWNGERL